MCNNAPTKLNGKYGAMMDNRVLIMLAASKPSHGEKSQISIKLELGRFLEISYGLIIFKYVKFCIITRRIKR